MAKIPVVLSGIQPSGALHLGNYFGAVRQYLELIEKRYRCFFFLANYHALTSLRSKDELLRLTHDAAANYIAMGLDPDHCVIYRQSDVPEVCELAWILTTITPMGLLERCHAYKDKVAQGLSADHGLFAYPVLQAADILIVRADLVPVGKDQKQHIEVARDIAQRFNATYGNVLAEPEPYIPDEVATVPGIDGRKMSKSYGNTVDLFAPDKKVRSQIMSIVTDSATVAEPKDPSKCNVFALLKLFLDAEERSEWEDRYRQGGMGYGDVKKALFEKFLGRFGAMRRRREELERNKDLVEHALREGARKMREVGLKVVDEVRAAVGIPPRS
ncbi:MAG: tryptophan--tRNA ligase [Planctomycetota bacterium]